MNDDEMRGVYFAICEYCGRHVPCRLRMDDNRYRWACISRCWR